MKMIQAGACALQIENQVSDEKQCGHQDGKVTVPHEDFIAKIRACRYAFLELGVEDGIIVARTDSLGAGLTKQIAYSSAPGDLAAAHPRCGQPGDDRIADLPAGGVGVEDGRHMPTSDTVGAGAGRAPAQVILPVGE